MYLLPKDIYLRVFEDNVRSSLLSEIYKSI